MLTIRPVEINFVCHVIIDDFPSFVENCLNALSASDIPSIETWQVPNYNLEGDTDISKALGLLYANTEDNSVYLKAVTANDLELSLRQSSDTKGSIGTMQLDHLVSPSTTEVDLLAFMQMAADLCRELIRTAKTYSVELTALMGGARCLPGVPFANINSHLVLVWGQAVEDNYDDVQSFWNSGWDAVETFGKRKLLLRAMDTVCGPELLRKIIDQQWRLARAAKGGKTSYFLPQPMPSELGIFHSGIGRLETVGYSTSDKTLEYSCVLERGQHIPGWEIYGLWNQVQKGQLEGKEISDIRVVFLDRWAAEQEKRPLLDIGCRVYCYADDGELQEFTE